MQLWTYVQMPAMALGAAVSAMAAQNIGAGLWDRVGRITRVGIGQTLTITAAMIVALTLADRSVLALFMGGDSPALPIARHIHVVATWNFLLFGVMMVLFGTVRANGAVWIPMIVLAVGWCRSASATSSPPTLAGCGRDLDELPGDLGDQPGAGDRLLLHGGWKKARMRRRRAAKRGRVHRGSARHSGAGRCTQSGGVTTHSSSPRKRGLADRKMGSRFRGNDDRGRTCPLPSPTSACAAAARARGCARCSLSTGFTRPTSSGRCSSATAAIARSRSALFRASAAGASTGSAAKAREAADLESPASRSSPTRRRVLRTERAEEALNRENLICWAIKAIKEAVPDIGVLTDVALDPYTAHGHDGIVDGQGNVINDETVEILVKQALVQAEAGADIVAPSDMMDGRVAAIREALEREGHQMSRSWPMPPNMPRPSTVRSARRSVRSDG